MSRIFTFAFMLMISFSTFAAKGGDLLDLGVGDSLAGMDTVSKQSCLIEVLGRSEGKRKLTLTLGVTVGDTTYEPFEVTERFVIGRTTLYKQLSKVVDNVAWNTVTVDATLQENQFTGSKSFKLERTVWKASYYSPQKIINCNL